MPTETAQHSANTIAACLLGTLHVPSTHDAAVVSRPFHQGKHVELGGLRALHLYKEEGHGDWIGGLPPDG
jgi:hypothetical protein